MVGEPIVVLSQLLFVMCTHVHIYIYIYTVPKSVITPEYDGLPLDLSACRGSVCSALFFALCTCCAFLVMSLHYHLHCMFAQVPGAPMGGRVRTITLKHTRL